MKQIKVSIVEIHPTVSYRIDKTSDKKLRSRLRRKLDVYLLPLLALISFLTFLDRTNVANAKLFGIERDINLSPMEYRRCLSIFFLGVVLFGIPSSIFLRRWQPSKWIALITFLWGTAAISMAVARNYLTLLLCRFLLGIFESGLFPGFTYYISLWYARKHQASRVGLLWAFSAIAGASGGLLAYSIDLFKPVQLAGWQLLFIIQGVPNLVLAVICWFYLPDSLVQATFLSDEQRMIQFDQLTKDLGGSSEDSFSWAQAFSVFTDWKTYIYAIIHISGTVALQGATLFLPTLILEMGQWTKIQVNLLTVPPYLVAFMLIFAVSRSSDYFKERSYHLMLTNLLSIIGFLLLMFVDRRRVNILYLGIILVTAGNYANVSIKTAWFNNNFASLTRRAVSSATIASLGILGGVASGQIYSDSQKPRYFLGHSIALGCIVVQMISTISLRLIFRRLNHRRATMNSEQISQQIKRYGGAQSIGDRHPTFRYTL